MKKKPAVPIRGVVRGELIMPGRGRKEFCHATPVRRLLQRQHAPVYRRDRAVPGHPARKLSGNLPDGSGKRLPNGARILETVIECDRKNCVAADKQALLCARNARSEAIPEWWHAHGCAEQTRERITGRPLSRGSVPPCRHDQRTRPIPMPLRDACHTRDRDWAWCSLASGWLVRS
jgi:hypothetical protein